ncbi:MAG: RNA-binding S4 domain-containing protein [Rikenellaceae bacterium]|jgi:23S rRNA pseudouridine2605 synthase|nr:RNA-binding S4 domain-containing protein [Rikenellaceae bacterium]
MKDDKKFGNAAGGSEDRKEERPRRKSFFSRDDSKASTDGPDRRPAGGAGDEKSSFLKDKRPHVSSAGSAYRDDRPRENHNKDKNADGRRNRNDNRESRNGERPAGRSFAQRNDNNRYGKDRNRDYSRDDRKAPRPEGDTRRSFSPNFDADNRPKFDRGDKPRYDKPRFDKPGYKKDDRRPGEKPYEKSRYGKDKSGGRFSKEKSFGGKGRDARKSCPPGGFDSDYKPESYPTFNAPAIHDPLRLNKYISMSGVCSRREADELIREGRITVNGEVITEMGYKINSGDVVKMNGEQLESQKKVYILMNKPKGFVTTVEDPNADRTVMEIVKNACSERVYPVGRLDKNSLGVLLITNDGELTKKLTHPSYRMRKIYQVSLDKSIAEADMERLCEGVELEDGKAIADEVSRVGPSPKEVGIEIHSGKNRIVRRMFEAVGYRVDKLDRVFFAGLTKKGLRRGAWRYLTPREVAMLKSGSYE